MAHAQKPDFVFPRNGRVHLNRWGASVQSTAGSRGVRISFSYAGYTTFGGGVRILATHSIRQFPLHFPSRASPCATRFRTSSTAFYALPDDETIRFETYESFTVLIQFWVCKWLFVCFFLVDCCRTLLLLIIKTQSSWRHKWKLYLSFHKLSTNFVKIVCGKLQKLNNLSDGITM